MYFIILATAATLWKAGQTDIQSAADAAVALEPLAGPWAKTLLALGLIGAGFLAVPILTGSAAYAIAEAFGWKYGLNENPRRAVEFYAVIVIATLVGLAINFIGIDPIKALFWSAEINGVVAVPVIVIMMLITANRKIMGEFTVMSAPHYRLGRYCRDGRRCSRNDHHIIHRMIDVVCVRESERLGHATKVDSSSPLLYLWGSCCTRCDSR
jgi:Mn2+/Fe2+ NRAMP family transporter